MTLCRRRDGQSSLWRTAWEESSSRVYFSLLVNYTDVNCLRHSSTQTHPGMRTGGTKVYQAVNIRNHLYGHTSSRWQRSAARKASRQLASVFVSADDHILRHLERDSKWLQQQLGQFRPISRVFVTKIAFEEYPTPAALGPIMVSGIPSNFEWSLTAQVVPSHLSRSLCSRRRRADRHSHGSC